MHAPGDRSGSPTRVGNKGEWGGVGWGCQAVPSLIRTEPQLRSDELWFFGFARAAQGRRLGGDGGATGARRHGWQCSHCRVNAGVKMAQAAGNSGLRHSSSSASRSVIQRASAALTPESAVSRPAWMPSRMSASDGACVW